MYIEKASRRGQCDFNWLKGYHYFTFGSYYNPLKTQFGEIKAINEYFLQNKHEFALTTHKDFEIITIVLEG